MSEDDDSFSGDEDAIHNRDDILQPKDNPHELMIVKCCMCLTTESDPRESLNRTGWKSVIDNVYVCTDCCSKTILWCDVMD
jgi:hypothetical protein